MMGDELTRMMKRVAEMHGEFEILSVERKRHLFTNFLYIRALDKATNFSVTAVLDGNPDMERIIEALKYELDEVIRCDKIWKLERTTIKY